MAPGPRTQLKLKLNNLTSPQKAERGGAFRPICSRLRFCQLNTVVFLYERLPNKWQSGVTMLGDWRYFHDFVYFCHMIFYAAGRWLFSKEPNFEKVNKVKKGREHCKKTSTSLNVMEVNSIRMEVS